jgi:hypothetical protein
MREYTCRSVSEVMLFRKVAQRQCVDCGRTFRDSVAVPFSRFDKFVEMSREYENYALSQTFGKLLHAVVGNFPEHRRFQTVPLPHPCFWFHEICLTFTCQQDIMPSYILLLNFTIFSRIICRKIVTTVLILPL